MSDYLTELLAVNSDQALNFFFGYLETEVASKRVTDDETWYVASVLAHYAQTCRYNRNFMSPSGSLYEILDNFILPGLTEEGRSGLQDPDILEIAGSHTLLLVGFFRDHMNKRNKVEWYDCVGSSFFDRASYRLLERKKAILLQRIAENFPLWAISCRNVSRTLKDERYLLKL